MRALVLAACLAALSAAATARAGTGLIVGFDEDTPKTIGAAATGPARDLGARAVRVTLPWSAGQTLLTSAEQLRLSRAVGAMQGLRLVLAVYGTSASATPLTATARTQFCTYARNAVARFPSVNDVVIGNEPNTAYFWRPQFDAAGASVAPAAYEALLARCWDVLHAYRPGVNVIGLALASRGNDNPAATSNVAHSPGNFIRRVGEAYRASGRRQRIMDTVAHHPYGAFPGERPWRQHIGSTTIAQGDWNKLMSNLRTAFEGTGQPLPGACGTGRCVSLWYTESGVETRVDPDKAWLYTGAEVVAGVLPDEAGGEPESPPPAPGSASPDQATHVRDAIRLAACQPHVGAIFNFLLFDEPRLAGWQSGPYWADRTPKGSQPAFRAAIAEANANAVDCEALKGGRPSGDYALPSAPGGLTATSADSPLRVDLAWTPSADTETGVAGYRVYRNGGYHAWAASTAFTDLAVAPSTAYAYTVYAQDGAGNLSPVSARVTATTPAAPLAPAPAGTPAFLR